MKKIVYTFSGLLSLGLAYLSFEYGAFTLFRIGLSDFYNIAPQVPEMCNEVVASAAVAFTGVFSYIAWTVSVLFVFLALFLTWRGWFRSSV